MSDDAHPGTADSLPPLAAGSPEEAHILDHGMYLAPRPTMLARFALLILANLMALIVLFVWTGTMLGDIGAVSASTGGLRAVVGDLNGEPLPVAVVGVIASVLVVIGGLYSGSLLARYALTFVGALGIIATAEPALRGLDANQWLSHDGSWLILCGAGLALMTITAAIGVLLRRREQQGIAAATVNWSQIVVVRITGGILLLWSGLVWYRLLLPAVTEPDPTTSSELRAFALFMGSLVFGFAFSYVPDRASLHREYRDRIRSCFGTVRATTERVEPVAKDLLLSELRSSGNAAATSPELLICATANAANSVGGRRRAFAPFVLAADQCGVPATTAVVATTKLELIQKPSGFGRSKEPLMTLFSAVATTGAAVSPSMGRMTIASARPVLAALNVRLGRWLPNLFNLRVRNQVESITSPGPLWRGRRKDTGMGPGYNELIPEMLGLAGRSVYVSDGGHFDNLGLLALFRARCAEIWCVDASPDRRGSAAELRRVLKVAAEDIGVVVDIDLDDFAADATGLYKTVHAHGQMTYGPGETGVLHVVKLGLTHATPQPLLDYRLRDKRFPHHPTVQQWYRRPRIEAYRDLGRFAAKLAAPSCTDSAPARHSASSDQRSMQKLHENES